MESVPMTIAAAIGGVLVTAVLALWKYVAYGNKKCEERNDRLEREIKLIHDMIFKRAAQESERADSRERWAWERAAELSKALNGIGEVTSRALRVLRRYDPDLSTPIPGTNEDTALILNVKK